MREMGAAPLIDISDNPKKVRKYRMSGKNATCPFCGGYVIVDFGDVDGNGIPCPGETCHARLYPAGYARWKESDETS
jgi:hypothetical protein